MPDVSAAPATPAPPVSPAPASVVDSAPPSPVATAPDVASSSVEPPATTAVATGVPSPDDFGWDAWDGSVDALPEPLRPWGAKLSEHYTRTVEDLKAEALFAQKTYEDLSKGLSDPRLEKIQAQLDAKLAELETFKGTQAEWEKKVAAADAKAAEVEKAYTAFVDEQAKAFADNFFAERKWMLDGGPIEALASELLDEGFELNDLDQLLRLPEPSLAKVRENFKELAGAKNAGKHAIRLALAEPTVQPNPAASLVDGANRIAAPPSELPRAEGESLNTRLDRVVDLAMRKMNRS